MVLVICLVAGLLARATAAERRVLLAASNNLGLAGEEKLRHAKSDAKSVAALFVGLGDVRAVDSRVLDNASPGAVEKALTELGRHKADTLIVYYSGHGDEAALHMNGKKLPLARLRQRIAKFPAAMKILIIDACRSVGAARKKGWGLKKAVAISLQAPAGPRGSVELRASSEGEPSRESDELRGGVFTHYLLTGLRGAADENGDGQVTLGEVYPYAYSRTLLRATRARTPVQHPYADLDYRGVGPLVLTRTARARAALSFPAGAGMQYLVFRLPSLSVVAEVGGEAGRRVRVALPSGRYLVHRLGRNRSGATEVALTFGGERRLGDGSFAAYPRETLAARGGGHLVHRHLLTTRYGFVVTHGGAMGQRLSAGFGHHLRSLTLEARAVLGEIYEDQAHLEHRRRWVGGEALGTWHFGAGPLTASVSSGVSVQARQQVLRQLEVEPGVGPDAEAGSTAATYVAGGPLLEGGIDLYISSRVAASLGIGMTLLVYKETEALAAALDTSAWVGVSVAF